MAQRFLLLSLALVLGGARLSAAEHPLVFDFAQSRIEIIVKATLGSFTGRLSAFEPTVAVNDQVRQFSADASHELKTPLALIRLNAEKLRSRLATDAEGSEALDDILEEITQLNQVIDRLLFLAKSESGALALELQPLVLETLIQGLAEDAQVLAEDRGVRFAVTRRVPGELRAEPDLLRQLLLNLVTNAVAVSPPDGVVAFESFPDGDDWTFVVADEGPGLPEEQRTRIFERFVRFNTGDRIGPQRGHGLGLAICKSIAELHGGTIRAERRIDRSGLRLVVTIPRQPK